MRGVGRDLIRGGHYGQRSCEPHQKAEHMAAPTNAAKREKSSCQPGAVHTWHFLDVTGRADDVRSSEAVSTDRRNTLSYTGSISDWLGNVREGCDGFDDFWIA